MRMRYKSFKLSLKVRPNAPKGYIYKQCLATSLIWLSNEI
jgi:hypothetical protein